MPLTFLHQPMFSAAWIYLRESFVLQLFAVSVIALLLGILQKVWAEAWKLKFLEMAPINTIEFTHPHIPSRKVIVCIFLCAVALLIVAIPTMRGSHLFGGTLAWMQLAGFFILAGSAGALAELHWPGTRDYAFACITGSAMALITIVWRFAAATHDWNMTLLHASLLVLCLLLAWRLLFHSWNVRIQLTAVIIFALWLLLNL